MFQSLQKREIHFIKSRNLFFNLDAIQDGKDFDGFSGSVSTLTVGNVEEVIVKLVVRIKSLKCFILEFEMTHL